MSIAQKLQEEIEKFKKAFLQPSASPFEGFLKDEDIVNIVDNTPHERDSVFKPLVTLKAFLFQVLSEDGSCRNAVAGVLADRESEGKPANSVNTGPYCKARQKLPTESIKTAVIHTGVELHQKSDKRLQWKGFNPLIADGTTVIMPDSLKNQEKYPQPKSQKPGLGFPIIRIVILVSLAVGGILNYSLAPYQGKQTGEASLFKQIIDSLTRGDLFIADRYYCTFAIITLLQRKGIPVIIQSHSRRKINFRLGKKLGVKDHLIEWKKPKRKPVWMTDVDFVALPDTLTVREFSVDGIVYVTTLLDAHSYTKRAIANFYKERWHIELDIRAIKTHMGMEQLSCKTPEMVEKEIAVYFLAYNIIRGAIAQAAVLHKKIPRKLSFKSALQLISKTTQIIVLSVGDTLNKALQNLLKAIASIAVGLQKRKNQPRAIKGRKKPYSLLTMPRAEACANL